MPDVADDFTALAADLIGHGESAKPMGDYSLGAHVSGLRDLLAKLEIGAVAVIGHSLGGWLARQSLTRIPSWLTGWCLSVAAGWGARSAGCAAFSRWPVPST
jgi:pimeloyl-ACP methyl ester carboxylesterase